MLNPEENALLTRIGPGTPMGDLIRQYWIPTLMSSELHAPDGPPVRVRLLGENLIAFRTTSGKVGLLPHACPHRGASLFFGRNEAEGIRCVRTRRRLMRAAIDVREGVTPPAVDLPELYRQRSGGVILPRSVDWVEATEQLRQAFACHPELVHQA
jgi:nitrite reductase/ring-hydroxylating ferredoxin subunit